MRLSLKNKFLLIILLIIFLFGSLAVISVFFYSRNAFANNQKNGLQTTLKEMTEEASHALVRGSSLVKRIASHDMIVEYVNGEKNLQDIEILYDLEHFSNPDVYSAVYILDKNGLALTSTDPAFVGNNYGFRKYFQEAISGRPYTESLLGVTSGKVGYYFSYPIHNKNDQEVIGVVVAKMKPEFIDNVISLEHTDLKIMFTDYSGIILFSNVPGRLYKSLGELTNKEKEEMVKYRRFEGMDIQPIQYGLIKEKLNSLVGDNIEVIEIYDDVDQERELLAVSMVEDFPFFLVIEQDLEKIVLPAFVLAAILSIFVLLCIFCATFMVIWTVSRYLRPLEKINNAAKKISAGDYDVRVIPDHTSVEFDNLAKVFNKMIEDINKSRKNIEKKVQEQTQKIMKHSQEMEVQQKAVLNILEDVEIEKTNAENLAIDLEKFKLAVDSASDHIVITDRSGAVVYANKAVERITGYTITETIGKKAGALWGKQMDVDFYKKLWGTILNKKQSFYGEIKNKRKNGELYDALISISPILDENNEVVFFVGIERDITREKEIDRAKTEFVSLASHQLRTPLSTINWYAEMLLSGDAGKLNKTQKDYLSEIAKGNQRMVNLVNALLNVSRIEVGTFMIDISDIDIVDTAEQTIGELTPLINKRKIKLNKNFDSNLGTFKADPKLLKIVFDNLLSNAVKYTPEKGEVNFEIKKEKKQIVITISDNGIGIPKAQQDKIYTKLFRADNARESDTDGTGLGLYIVKAIIDGSGGKISFESGENKGTKFTVVLPEKGMQKREGTKSLL